MNKNQGGGAGTNRVGAFSMCMIIMALVATLNNMTTGGTIGIQVTFKTGIIAFVIGAVLATCLTSLTGTIGPRERLNAASILKITFGEKGFLIPSFLVGLCLLMWAMFDFWYVGSIMKNMMPSHPNAGFAIGILFIVIVACLGAIRGISSLKWLSDISLPIAIILFFIIIMASVKMAGGMSAIMMNQPENPISLLAAINLYIGLNIVITGLYSDFTHEAKTPKTALLAIIIGGALILYQMICGLFGAVGLGCLDITSLSLKLGGPLFIICNIYVLVAQANTVAPCCHTYSTQLNATTKLPKKLFTVLGPCITGAMAFVIEYVADISAINTYIGFVAILFSPMVAIEITNYWVVNKGHFNQALKNPVVRKPAVIALAIGFVIGVWCTFATSLPTTIVTLLSTAIIYVILCKVFKAGEEEPQEDNTLAETVK